jgi:hypothetical protein
LAFCVSNINTRFLRSLHNNNTTNNETSSRHTHTLTVHHTCRSSSEKDSKIDLIDDEKSVRRKIKKVFCEEGNVTKNPLLSFIEHVVFMVRGQFTLEVRDKEPVLYKEFGWLPFANGSVFYDLSPAPLYPFRELHTLPIPFPRTACSPMPFP